MRFGSALFRYGLASSGYIVAVTVAVAATIALMLGEQMLRAGLTANSLADLGLSGIFAIGFFWTFLCALPGFIVAVIIGERHRWTRWTSYALAGAANAAPSLAFFAGLAGSPLGMPIMLVAAFPGGFAGGAAYWLATGRIVAGRREATSP